MNPLVARAELLLHQDRYEQAADTLRQALLQSPEDAHVHRLLAICLSEQEKFDEATSHAQQAVHLAPEDPYTHYVLCSVLADRRRWPQARAAIEEALALQPADPDFYGMLARIAFAQEKWRDALDAAESGLAIDGENAACINLRAMAQVKLGDKSGAASTIDQALQRRPDDPVAHANQGWVLLEQGNPKKAVEHFREALRLKPDFEWARQGIVAALKAHNPIYRVMLGWFLWMAKLPSQARWGIIIGGYVGYRFLRDVARKTPEWAPWIWPVLIAYIIFAVMTWLVDPFFNLMLRLHPWGRHALSRDEVRGANLLVGSILLPVPFVLAAWLLGSEDLVLPLLLGLIAIPASAVYRCEKGWPQKAAAVITVVLVVAGVIGALPLEPLLPKPLASIWGLLSALSFLVFALGVFLSQFVMNYLMTVVPRR